jgi:hypothetical protein
LSIPISEALLQCQYFGHFLSERDEQMRPQTGEMW